MQPKNHFLLLVVLCALFLGGPLSGFGQIEEPKVRQEQARKKEAMAKRLHYGQPIAFQFGPGQERFLELPIAPPKGFFTLEATWRGNASALRAQLIRVRSFRAEYVRVESRSPLYLSHFFEAEAGPQKESWIVRLESMHPNLVAKGTLSIRSAGDRIEAVRPGPGISASDQTLTFAEFNELDRRDWGAARKDFESDGTIRVRYANGNWVKKEKGAVVFYDAQTRTHYEVVPGGRSGPHVIMAAQAPSEPPDPSLFTGQASFWRNSVERWLEDYNAELLEEIEALMDHDPELIERYRTVEQNRELEYFELLKFRATVIKDLRMMYGA